MKRTMSTVGWKPNPAGSDTPELEARLQDEPVWDGGEVWANCSDYVGGRKLLSSWETCRVERNGE